MPVTSGQSGKHCNQVFLFMAVKWDCLSHTGRSGPVLILWIFHPWKHPLVPAASIIKGPRG